MTAVILAVLSLITLCVILPAQTIFSQILLQGTVTDNGGAYLGSGAEPVVNALVTLTDQTDPGRIFSDTTDAYGHYSIQITQTGVDDDPSANPDKFRLYQNYPNPFNPSTVIGYELAKPARIRIDIYNVLGQKVKTLLDGFQSSTGQVIWNATDDRGQGVPAGVYIYTMQAVGEKINRKMLLLDGHHGGVQTVIPSNRMANTGPAVLDKRVSDTYRLEITGEDVATYVQQDLDIPVSMTVDVTVSRTVTDIDGNVYQTVKIGDQWWMAENLKATHYRNGEAIPNVTDATEWKYLITGAYCDYDDDSSNVVTHGRLYNWYAVNDNRNIAPEGWHVPTDEEWKELEMFLGMSQSEADETGIRGTDEGGKLKEVGTIHWISPNSGATNESGFSALPSGSRISSVRIYYYMGLYTYLWSSSAYTNSSAWGRALYYKHSTVSRYNYPHMRDGFSVRCVGD
jgi:uncharacterized protein (TIGR02145 family)